MTRRIEHIIPGAGWRAAFAAEEDNRPFVITEELACWLVVSGDETVDLDVQGMVAHKYIDSVEDDENFLGYVGPNDDPDKWLSAAYEHFEALRRRASA